MKPVCILMAAGVGSRFGANKLLAEFGGKPLFQWAMDAVDPDDFSRVIVVTGHTPVAQAAAALGYDVVINDKPEDGVSRTIRLGLEKTDSCSGALFMTADQPLLTRQTLHELSAAFVQEPDRIIAAAHDGIRGNPCVFPAEFFRELMALEGDRGGSVVIRRHPERLRLLQVAAQELMDCDTPETMEICREKLDKKVENYAKNHLTSP